MEILINHNLWFVLLLEGVQIWTSKYGQLKVIYNLEQLKRIFLIWKLMGTKRSLSSVQFSRSVMSNSLRSHESQQARPPCPSPTTGVHPDLRPLRQRCDPAISSCVIPFSSCPQSLPESESLPMSQLFTWGGQSTGVSALASFLPKKPQSWSPSDGLVGSPCSPRDSQESSPTPQLKSINSSVLSLLHSPTLTSIHDHWKNHSLD